MASAFARSRPLRSGDRAKSCAGWSSEGLVAPWCPIVARQMENGSLADLAHDGSCPRCGIVLRFTGLIIIAVRGLDEGESIEQRRTCPGIGAIAIAGEKGRAFGKLGKMGAARSIVIGDRLQVLGKQSATEQRGDLDAVEVQRVTVHVVRVRQHEALGLGKAQHDIEEG